MVTIKCKDKWVEHFILHFSKNWNAQSFIWSHGLLFPNREKASYFRSSTKLPANVRWSQHNGEDGFRLPEEGVTDMAGAAQCWVLSTHCPHHRVTAARACPLAPSSGPIPSHLTPPPSLKSGLDFAFLFFWIWDWIPRKGSHLIRSTKNLLFKGAKGT